MNAGIAAVTSDRCPLLRAHPRRTSGPLINFNVLTTKLKLQKLLLMARRDILYPSQHATFRNPAGGCSSPNVVGEGLSLRVATAAYRRKHDSGRAKAPTRGLIQLGCSLRRASRRRKEDGGFTPAKTGSMDRVSKENLNCREDDAPEDDREECKEYYPAENRKIMKKREGDNLPGREISHVPPLFSDDPFGCPHCMKLDIISRARLRVKPPDRLQRREPRRHIPQLNGWEIGFLRTGDLSHSHTLAEQMIQAE